MTGTTTTQETTAELSADPASETAAGEGQTDTAQGTAGESEPTGLSLDLVFESLKNSRRRQVLRYLQTTEGAASVGELAEHVAAIENDTTVQALSSQQRKRVYVGLYQCHLPKLDDKDVIEYDDDRGTVELGPNAPQLEQYLAVADGDEDDDGDRPWHRYYLGAAGGAILTLVLAAVVLGGNTLFAAATVTGIGLLVGVSALSLTHARQAG